MHSGGLVGHAYGHSHDNIAALTPPPSAPMPHELPPLRTRLTNTIWEDEHTFCYQVDVKGVCVARRADNHMVNGTKLLNVVGMSRGKRDGILKNEKGRVVVKVGAMHLKGVWIPLDRAAHHAKAHNIEENLYPLLVDDPTMFLYQHPHTAAVSSDMRWPSQSQQPQQHGSYHDNDNSPKARHSDMHPNHHFSQSVHGDYYAHQHHTIFRNHGVSSPHGSPHGSNGSVSGDDDPNLVSPFEYRMQQPSMPGGLIGLPGGPPVSDLRSGNHHAAYYGHQAGPNQYYGAHVQHPGQHPLQIGGQLANDSPPLSTAPGHEGSQSRLQASLLSGQKRGYGTNVPESTHNYYGYQATHPQKSHSISDVYSTDPGQFGLASSGVNTGSFSPPTSMTPSEPHSPMSQQHQAHHAQDQHGDIQLQNTPQNTARHSHSGIIQPMNPPNKRPRQVSRSISMSADSPASSSGQWYGREDGFDRASSHSVSSSEATGSGPVNYSVTGDSNNSMYYDALAQQQQPKSFNTARETDAGSAGRPRFIPGTTQAAMQYGAGASSPQRSRSRLSSFQDGASAGGTMPQQGNMSPFGRMHNSMSPDDTKQAGYVRPQSGPEAESNPQLVKVEAFAHEATTSWS
ncbi:hypothetical protein BGZ65_001993 [Modicella reniformis]|uniref:HTH APSES-type domain-containing protein n=1 Tax=Modicella reniformis TaxID=1440133 RepID=A0A9P6MJG9_9FUNG|nr:hypothetical protein BGZ65_001993 [Modicella reniformis]